MEEDEYLKEVLARIEDRVKRGDFHPVASQDLEAEAHNNLHKRHEQPYEPHPEMSFLSEVHMIEFRRVTPDVPPLTKKLRKFYEGPAPSQRDGRFRFEPIPVDLDLRVANGELDGPDDWRDG